MKVSYIYCSEKLNFKNCFCMLNIFFFPDIKKYFYIPLEKKMSENKKLAGHSRDGEGQSATDGQLRKMPAEGKGLVCSPDVFMILRETVWSCEPLKLALALAPL